MALTIEDGTGVDGADSFVNVATFSQHADDYLDGSLSGSNTEKERALRRAWVYMGGLEWKPDYPWPTLGGTIPEKVKLAQSILARAEFKATNYLSPQVTLSESKVLNQVDAIGWSVKHGPATVEANRPVVSMAFDLLKDYLVNGDGGVTGGKTQFVARA